MNGLSIMNLVLVSGNLLLLSCALAAGPVEAVSAKELVGEYERGSGLSDNLTLRILSEGRFNYEVDSDIGPQEKGAGSLTTEGAMIILVRETESLFGETSTILGSRLVMISWGERLYLVEDNRLIDFVNDVNLGAEPRRDWMGGYLLRSGDWKKEVSATPRVPESRRSFLLSAPLVGKVIRLLSPDRFEVDIGARMDLRVGMQLVVDPDRDKWGMATVETVGERTSTAVQRLASPNMAIALGQKVSTHY